MEESIGVVCQRQRKCGGGRLGSWSAGVSWLLRCVITVGVRACARGSDASRNAAGAPASWLVCVLRSDARDLARVVRAAPSRWRRGDRRGAAPGGGWRRSSPDRSASGPAGRDGSWLAAGRPPANRGATQRRGALGGCAGSRARRDPAVRFSARRGRRGVGGCRKGMDAAVRSRSGWRVGARGRDDRRRSAQRPAARPARVPSADPPRGGSSGRDAANAIRMIDARTRPKGVVSACGCSNLATGRDLSRTDSPLFPTFIAAVCRPSSRARGVL